MTGICRLVLLLCCLGATVPAQNCRILVDKEFAAIRATRRESQWRLIPWRASLKAALAEAQKANKPVYMFCADGIWETGNC